MFTFGHCPNQGGAKTNGNGIFDTIQKKDGKWKSLTLYLIDGIYFFTTIRSSNNLYLTTTKFVGIVYYRAIVKASLAYHSRYRSVVTERVACQSFTPVNLSFQEVSIRPASNQHRGIPLHEVQGEPLEQVANGHRFVLASLSPQSTAKSGSQPSKPDRPTAIVV